MKDRNIKKILELTTAFEVDELNEMLPLEVMALRIDVERVLKAIKGLDTIRSNWGTDRIMDSLTDWTQYKIS